MESRLAESESLRTEMQSTIDGLKSYVDEKERVMLEMESQISQYVESYQGQMNQEMNMIGKRLQQSTHEVLEYQEEELMIAAQNDEGCTIRIEDLERKRDLMESSAAHIFRRGQEHFDSLGVAGARLVAAGPRQLLRGSRSTLCIWRYFCVASAAHCASGATFAKQAQCIRR